MYRIKHAGLGGGDGRQTGLIQTHKSKKSRYPITEPLSVLSSMHSVEPSAQHIITYIVKPSHGVERGREGERKQPSRHSQQVEVIEHLDCQLDEVQLKKTDASHSSENQQRNKRIKNKKINEIDFHKARLP